MAAKATKSCMSVVGEIGLDGRLGHGNSSVWYSTATIGGTFNVMDCEGDQSDGVGEVGIDVVSGSWIAGSVRAVLATVVMVATRKMVSFRRGGREGG
jgi:hypothetical protein